MYRSHMPRPPEPNAGAGAQHILCGGEGGVTVLVAAERIDTSEAHRLGMVNRVVPRDELDTAVMALAAEIAEHDPFALRPAKRAVNQTLDVIRFTARVPAVFDIHQIGHGNALSVSGRR